MRHYSREGAHRQGEHSIRRERLQSSFSQREGNSRATPTSQWLLAGITLNQRMWVYSTLARAATLSEEGHRAFLRKTSSRLIARKEGLSKSCLTLSHNRVWKTLAKGRNSLQSSNWMRERLVRKITTTEPTEETTSKESLKALHTCRSTNRKALFSNSLRTRTQSSSLNLQRTNTEILWDQEDLLTIW